MNTDNGGAAFPVIEKQYEDRRDGGFFFESTAGMTLRDYFAAKAMAEILARWGSHQEIAHASIASLAYSMADAMIAERAK